MRVLVVYGGDSSERSISLISGTNVGNALDKAGHTVTYFDPASGLHKLSDSLKGIDVVFPILHGTGGEDGFIQKALELENVPFVGSDSDVSAECFDKWQTIQKAKNILFPKTEIVSQESIKQSQLLKSAYVIKPRSEGSSVDTFLVRNPQEFDLTKLDEVFDRYNGELLLEEFINGQEITVAVLGDTALPVVEIIPPAGQDFDFTNKYNGATAENCPPKHVSEDLQLKAQAIALDLHKTMGCRDYSRTDFIIDKQGAIFTLEINTIPGMTAESLFPLAAKTAGVSMAAVVDSLITDALRYNTG